MALYNITDAVNKQLAEINKIAVMALELIVEYAGDPYHIAKEALEDIQREERRER